MKATHFVRIVTSAAAVFVLAACSRPEPAPEPVRSVKLLTVGSSALDASAEYAGEVRAQVESRLGFRVGGKLLERPAELGQRVKPGQLLARLDAQDLALSSQAAQAAELSATAKAKRCEEARHRYESYMNARRLYEPGETENERRYLTDAEIDSAREKALQVMNTFCNEG